MNRQVPFVPQMEVAECGVACLAMVLGYHGRHVPLYHLRERSGVGRDGMDAATLLQLARSEGLEAKGVKASLDVLRTHKILPCILHWKMDHFLVAERATRRGLVLVDPNAGRRTASWKEVSRNFSGICLLFNPGEDFKNRA